MDKTPDFDRRQFVGAAAATVAAGPLGLLGRVNAMTHAVTDVAQPKGRADAELAHQLRDDVGDAAHPPWDAGHR